MKTPVIVEAPVPDRRAVYVCDGCGDTLESGPGLCSRCQAPLIAEVPAEAWLAALLVGGAA